MLARATGGEMAGLDRTPSAATGPRKAAVWMPRRTRSTGTPLRTCGGAGGRRVTSGLVQQHGRDAAAHTGELPSLANLPAAPTRPSASRPAQVLPNAMTTQGTKLIRLLARRSMPGMGQGQKQGQSVAQGTSIARQGCTGDKGNG
mgnify:CR=1 FL=1